ncbi:hypothetical protein BDZ97DRAFT_1755380 [Flammula alnicola]|nr:hypothetical protein BDZ97DRAFT_1755380 [Flammula alnicola]
MQHLLDLCLERSKQLPLKLFFRMPSKCYDDSPSDALLLLKLISQNFRRLEDITFMSTDKILEIILPQNQTSDDLLNVKRLDIILDPHGSEVWAAESQESSIFRQRLDSRLGALRDLHISLTHGATALTDGFHDMFLWSQLVSLTLDISICYGDLMHILEKLRCSNLTILKLEIRELDFEVPVDDQREIALDHLSNLSVNNPADVEPVLAYLRVPNLRELSVKIGEKSSTAPFDPILHLLRRSHCPLEKLTVPMCTSNSNWLRNVVKEFFTAKISFS